MRILNFNIRFGGEKRTPKIVEYLLKNDFDMIVLTEFIKNDNGQEIIHKLVNKGYKTQPSNEKGGMGSFIACKDDFVTKNVMDRWVEVYIPKMDLYVLGVYVPDQAGTEKNLFWKKILDYAEKNLDKNVLITGDFNSCTKYDSSNKTEYNANDLIKLEELEYIDLWKYNPTEDSDGYTWFHHSGTGFRLDYAFVSPKLIPTLEDVSIYSDSQIRESKISDHSPIVVI
ncbi:endonuclease/exonuclease/phosphatase family protein [Methanobacterium sp.]|uniref:endonuclease/exonuclease/phosphatase family protein n=1 Tax=Methanobacterium sp. TaxID=2164 RepID=UPI003D6477CF